MPLYTCTLYTPSSGMLDPSNHSPFLPVLYFYYSRFSDLFLLCSILNIQSELQNDFVSRDSPLPSHPVLHRPSALSSRSEPSCLIMPPANRYRPLAMTPRPFSKTRTPWSRTPVCPRTVTRSGATTLPFPTICTLPRRPQAGRPRGPRPLLGTIPRV